MITKDKASIRNVMQNTEISNSKDAQKIGGISVKLPLGIMGGGKPGEALKLKLRLISIFNFADTDHLLGLVKKKWAKESLTKSELSWLDGLWREMALDDLDVTELFVCYLPNIIDDQGRDALAMFDPMPLFNQKRCGDLYEEFIKHTVRKSAENVARVALPRVRAKLALREIICLVDANADRIAELIQLTPRYLNCPATTDLIAQWRAGLGSKNVRIKELCEQSLTKISKAQIPPKFIQPRKYGYWRIDYYFNEILECG